MVTPEFIDKNKTETLKKGDKVVMINCMEAKRHNGMVWECLTDSYKRESRFIPKDEVDEEVFLQGFSGAFYVKYLQLVKVNSSLQQS